MFEGRALQRVKRLASSALQETTVRLLRCVSASLLVSSILSGCASLPSTSVGEPAGNEVADSARNVEPAAEAAAVTSAEAARQRAAQALAEGDVNQALELYGQAVELEPTDTESLYAIGVIRERQGDWNGAAVAYVQVVASEPEHALAQAGLGLAQFEAREWGLAREALERAVSIDPGLWRAHSTLGVIADMDERYEDAARHYTAALRENPGSATIHNNRGYSNYLDGKFDAAERDFLAAIDLDDDYDRAWSNLGLVYARQRRYEFALRALSQVMSRHVAANDIGYVAMLDGEYDAAAALFAEALRISPRYYPVAAQNATELRRRRGGEVLTQER
jgi:Flp pilus assembly protein TadD